MSPVEEQSSQIVAVSSGIEGSELTQARPVSPEKEMVS